MTAAGQEIIDRLRQLDHDTAHVHAGRIHDLMNRVVMLDADDQGAWLQAQTANKQLDGLREQMRTLKQGYADAFRKIQ